MNAPSTGWLSGSDLDRFREIGATRRSLAGTTLFREGDDPFDVALLEQGTVKLTKLSMAGTEFVLDLRESGAILGELSAIDRQARSATATAMTDVEMVSIGIDRFMEFLDERPSAHLALLTHVVSRLRFADVRQLELVSSDALGRVCARLIESCERAGVSVEAGRRFELGLNQTELAQWAGLSREAVVKALARLRALGWITTDGSQITIVDSTALTARAQH